MQRIILLYVSIILIKNIIWIEFMFVIVIKIIEIENKDQIIN